MPVDKLHPFYSGVRSYRDLPPILTEQIAHFFQHYKDLEKGKWVTIIEVGGAERRGAADPRRHRRACRASSSSRDLGRAPRARRRARK